MQLREFSSFHCESFLVSIARVFHFHFQRFARIREGFPILVRGFREGFRVLLRGFSNSFKRVCEGSPLLLRGFHALLAGESRVSSCVHLKALFLN
jgi:hypothetical protein